MTLCYTNGKRCQKRHKVDNPAFEIGIQVNLFNGFSRDSCRKLIIQGEKLQEF